MKIPEFIRQSLTESKEYIEKAVRGLSPEELTFRPKPDANAIAFLIWHLARIEDLWINRVLKGQKEIYESEAWYKKFKTSAKDSGFGYDVSALDSWPVSGLELLQSYATAVRTATLDYLMTLDENTLDEPRDFGWRKGTAGSALSHLVTEVGEHTGQIGYIRGIMKGIETMPSPPQK